MNAIVAGLGLKTVAIPEARRKATLQLLIATGYLRENSGRDVPGIPVLAESDKPQVNAALRDGKRTCRPLAYAQRLFRSRRPSAKVLHYEFGLAEKFLGDSGFSTNPQAKGGFNVTPEASAVIAARSTKLIDMPHQICRLTNILHTTPLRGD